MLLPAGVAAQAGDVVVTASRPALDRPSSAGGRLGLSALKTPAAVEVIDGDAIRARGDRTITDTVTRATGVTLVADPGNGNTALAARGFPARDR